MTSAPAVAFLTIGQSPRDDMLPDLVPHLGDCRIMEWGALDGLSRAQMRELAPSDDERMVVSRLSDGSQVRMAKRLVDPRVQTGIEVCERDGADLTVVTCTSTFPDFTHGRPVLLAGDLIRAVVTAVAGRYHLGAVCPDSAQVDTQRDQWAPRVARVSVSVASPYGPDAERAVAEQAEALRTQGADYILLDCMGYTTAMQRRARQQAGSRILLARTLLARVVGDLVA